MSIHGDYIKADSTEHGGMWAHRPRTEPEKAVNAALRAWDRHRHIRDAEGNCIAEGPCTLAQALGVGE